MSYWEIKPYEDMVAGQSGQGFQKMLTDYMDIYSGKKSPTELPMYKTFSNDLETMFSKAAPDIMKEATARGIRGGTLGNILSSGHTDLMDKSVRAIYDMYNQAPKAIGASYAGAAQLGESEINRALDFFEKYKGRHLQAQAAKQQGINQGIMSGASGCGSGMSGATGGSISNCMIFNTAGCLTCNVKKFRDEHYTVNDYVAKGYNKMAEWLVPVMLKHKTIKSLVRFLLKPLVVFADSYGKNDKLKMDLYAIPCLFLTGIWNLYGRI